MVSAAWGAGAGCLTALGLAACSLVIQDVDLAECNSDAQCEVLNRRGPSSVTACFRWQCAAMEGSLGKCVLRALDADDDGFVSAACPGGNDCDDARADARPGGIETCDGIDNDCDGVIDDGAFTTVPGSTGVLAVANVEQASFTGGWDPTFVYRTRTDEFIYTLKGSDELETRPALEPRAVVRPSDGGDYAKLGVTVGAEVSDACARLVDAMEGTLQTCSGDAECGERRTCEPPDPGGTARACRNADGSFQRIPCGGSGDRACGSSHVCVGEGGVGHCRDVPVAQRCSNEPGAEVRCLDPMATCIQERGFDGYCALMSTPAPPYVPMPCASANDCNEVCAGGYCVPGTRGDVVVTRGMGCQQLTDVAASSFEGGWVLAGVERSGCSAGILRIGLVAGDARRAFFFGPEARSNVTFGVDPVRPWEPRLLGLPPATANCTGRTRLRDGGAVGASAPAVAVEPGSPDALVAFRGGPAAMPGTCGGTGVPIEVLGVHREVATGTASGQWVNATNDGIPQRLGTSMGAGAPAVVSLGGGRPWLVAYGDARGDVALHLVIKPTSFPPPPGAGAPGYVPRPTDPLALTALGTLAARGADFVRAAVGRTRGSVTEVGLTWLEGCSEVMSPPGAPPTGTVRFARVRIDTAAGTLEADDALRLGSAARPPSVAFAPSGVLTVGYRRNDTSPAATETQTGGWAILWPSADGTELRGLRIAEFDGQPVEPATVVTGGLRNATLVGAYTGGVVGAGGGYGVVDVGTERVLGGNLFCGRP